MRKKKNAAWAGKPSAADMKHYLKLFDHFMGNKDDRKLAKNKKTDHVSLK